MPAITRRSSSSGGDKTAAATAATVPSAATTESEAAAGAQVPLHVTSNHHNWNDGGSVNSTSVSVYGCGNSISSVATLRSSSCRTSRKRYQFDDDCTTTSSVGSSAVDSLRAVVPPRKRRRTIVDAFQLFSLQSLDHRTQQQRESAAAPTSMSSPPPCWFVPHENASATPLRGSSTKSLASTTNASYTTWSTAPHQQTQHDEDGDEDADSSQAVANEVYDDIYSTSGSSLEDDLGTPAGKSVPPVAAIQRSTTDGTTDLDDYDEISQDMVDSQASGASPVAGTKANSARELAERKVMLELVFGPEHPAVRQVQSDLVAAAAATVLQSQASDSEEFSFLVPATFPRRATPRAAVAAPAMVDNTVSAMIPNAVETKLQKLIQQSIHDSAMERSRDDMMIDTRIYHRAATSTGSSSSSTASSSQFGSTQPALVLRPPLLPRRLNLVRLLRRGRRDRWPGYNRPRPYCGPCRYPIWSSCPRVKQQQALTPWRNSRPACKEMDEFGQVVHSLQISISRSGAA
jgi:hypothetical protein